MTEKTVTVSVGEGLYALSPQSRDTYIPFTDGSKVEAQTPEGTRVATPNPMRGGPTAAAARSSLLPKASYAAALKAKPSDWHLEFYIDEHKLPLDLTIYGAIHQHEVRKKTSPAISPSLIWQNVYSVRFKKVSGPAPLSDGN